MYVRLQICVAIVLVLLSMVGCASAPSRPVAGVHVDDISPMPYDVLGTKNQIVMAYPGYSTTYHMTITNTGTERNTYRLVAATPTSPLGWIALLQPLPNEITVDPDAEFRIPVSITVPLTATVGTRDMFEINIYQPGGDFLQDVADVSVKVR